MGNNVSLVAAVTGTTISSANYNTNLNALNNAASYTFSVGQISAINTFGGAGFGTYNHGINPFTPVNALITRSDGAAPTGVNLLVFGWNQSTATTSTIQIGASTGNSFSCTVYAPS